MRRVKRLKYFGSVWIFTFFLIFSCFQKSTTGSINRQEDTAETGIPSEAVFPLENKEDLDILIKEIGDANLVLLGEASHGTSEFYTWRAEISRRLIQEKGFTIIAVEGDWADALPLNDYIRGNNRSSSAKQALKGFDRWPTWMWANEEIQDLAEWLKTYNSGKTEEEQVSFYGLDVYGIWESMEAVHTFLEDKDPAASLAVMACFATYNSNENAYSRATRNSDATCEDVISAMVAAVKTSIEDHDTLTFDEFNALQNAYVVANAETYYRTAAGSYSASWNVRDLHMAGTMERLLEYHGAGSKMIVWEHNTHVGDARATDMADAGMVNIGQLARETYGNEEVYIVGFGTYSGKVIAAESWGAAPEVMNVPSAQNNSWEWMLHREEPRNKIVLMDPLKPLSRFDKRIGHRAIGVVYDPENERGNYVPSVLPERYDAFIFIDRTTALKPLANE